MLKNKGGFTLIELVMIIVILGILAAVAIPRYVGLQTDARKATIQGLYGTVRSAAQIVHAKALIEGKTTATGTVTMEDGTTVAVVYGYPSDASGGINNAVEFETSDFVFAEGSPSTFSRVGAADSTKCQVEYTDPATAGAKPTIDKDDTDCS